MFKFKNYYFFTKWLFLLIIISLFSLVGCTSTAIKNIRNDERAEYVPTEGLIPVKTIEVKQETSYQISRTYTGEVVASRVSNLGFERSGKLSTVFVDEGDSVEIDAPLANLNNSNLLAQRKSLVAQKTKAEAILAELKTGARDETIIAARANVRDLKNQLELEKLRQERREYLYNEGAITKEQLDEVTFNFKALSERFISAESNLKELLNGTRSEQIDAGQATVEQLEAQIADLDITIAKSTLLAPFSGIVAERYFDEGTVLEAGQPVIRLIEDTKPEVKVGVPFKVVSQLETGSKQQVEINDKIYLAKVKSVLPEMDSSTSTYSVILILEQTVDRVIIAPNQVARLKTTRNISTAGYWLPTSSLLQDERGLWTCYALTKVSDSEANLIATKLDSATPFYVEQRSLEVLHTQDDKVFVRGNIQTDDLIVTGRILKVVPGQLVTLEKPAQ